MRSNPQPIVHRQGPRTYPRRRSSAWRGHIIHMPSGKRRYLKSLDEIGDFISPYLEEMGETRHALAHQALAKTLDRARLSINRPLSRK